MVRTTERRAERESSGGGTGARGTNWGGKSCWTWSAGEEIEADGCVARWADLSLYGNAMDEVIWKSSAE